MSGQPARETELDGITKRLLALEAHPFLDSARNRLHLHVRASGCHQEIVSDRFQMLGFEHDQVVGLFFERRFGRDDSLV